MSLAYSDLLQRRAYAAANDDRISMLFGSSTVLGPICPNDLEPLFRWMGDRDIERFSEPYRPQNWYHHDSFWLNSDNDQSRIFFAIRLPQGPQIVGFVQIYSIHLGDRSARIAIRIGESAHYGKGYGREALALAVEYCRRHLNLGRVEITVFKNNAVARRIFTDLGFVEEKIERRALYIDGRWIDVISMALLLDG
jgi:[ribosomal protein S5]-alanine N-acetyltransferase